MPGQLYFEDVEVGMEVPSLSKRATTRQLVKYAGASRDFSEIHYDQERGSKSMWGRIIIHGMLKAGFLAQLATDFMGTEGLLLSLGCAYRAPDFPYENLSVRGRVVGKEAADGVCTVSCDAWVENEAGQTTTPGQFMVALPSRDGRKTAYPVPPAIEVDRNGTLKGERLLAQEDAISAHFGVWWKPWVSEVGRTWIALFAEAIGDPNPLYRDQDYAADSPHGGLIAPPTFVEALAPYWRRFELEAEPVTGEEGQREQPGTGGGDGWCEFSWHKPVRPGDTITGFTRVTERYEKSGRRGKLVFTPRHTVLENQHGEVVSTSRRSNVRVVPA